MKIHYANLLLLLVILLPNGLLLLFPPTSLPPGSDRPPGAGVVEMVGRVDQEGGLWGHDAVAGHLLCRLAALFVEQREYGLLFAPLWILPLPLAVSPILYFLLAARVMNTIPLLLAAVLFGIGHLPISYFEYIRSR